MMLMAGDYDEARVCFLVPDFLTQHHGELPVVPLVIRPRDGLSPIVDITGITPDRLASLDRDAVARLTVEAEGRAVSLGDLFTFQGSAADQRIECVGDFSRVDGVAAGMISGCMHVRGSVGRHAGYRMGGGELVVDGHAGDWLAAGMTGGVVRVEGNAGDDIAAALPGLPNGMTGGLVIVNGHAGTRVAARMRRGIVAIGGDCGPAAGFELRAGTLLVAGHLGIHPGLGMRRGSIVAAGPSPLPGPSFVRGATWMPPFLPLLGRRLAAGGFRPGQRPLSTPEGAHPVDAWPAGAWTQWHGDGVAGARGEMFTRQAG